jgi:hypothetical protein
VVVNADGAGDLTKIDELLYRSCPAVGISVAATAEDPPSGRSQDGERPLRENPVD